MNSEDYERINLVLFQIYRKLSGLYHRLLVVAEELPGYNPEKGDLYFLAKAQDELAKEQNRLRESVKPQQFRQVDSLHVY